jgi:hypothetical protein
MMEVGVQLFFRDHKIPELMASMPQAPVMALNNNDKVIGAYPPSGVVPHKKFAYYFAPICFISS